MVNLPTGVTDDAVSWFERNASSGALSYLLKDGIGGVDGLNSASTAVSLDGNLNDNSISWFDRNVSSGLAYGGTLDDVGGVDGLAGPRSILLSPDERNLYVAPPEKMSVSSTEIPVRVPCRTWECSKTVWAE